jgi:hypothetical protein
MASFKVNGWFEVDYEKRKGGRTLVFDDFWSEGSKAHPLAGECGCYVFAIKTGRGLEPIYVGKATKTFKQETFNPGNRHKYHAGFSEYAKGLPIIFFVVHPSQKGKKNEKEIGKIEQFLIQTGAAKNPGLQNVRGARRPKWSIRGVVRSNGKGKRTKAEGAFRRLFDLADK